MCNARIDQNSVSFEIRDCTHLNRNGPNGEVVPAGGAKRAHTVGLAGKLIGYDYKARAIARRLVKRH